MALEYCLSVQGAGNSYSVDNDTPFEPDAGNNTDPTREWIMIYVTIEFGMDRDWETIF